MRSTRIVTSFVMNRDRLLILKRSNSVRSMKGLWAGVSGIIERGEEPLSRAKIEIFEEIGMTANQVVLVRSGVEMVVNSPQYENHVWRIYPFLFQSNTQSIKLNWENSDFRWIRLGELSRYRTVPSLQKVLLSLLR